MFQMCVARAYLRSYAYTHLAPLPWQLLRDVHNFNTMMAVDAALQHTAVERLKKTFELMSDRKRQAWVSSRLGLSTTPYQCKTPHIPPHSFSKTVTYSL
jgi:hypothetical protein